MTYEVLDLISESMNELGIPYAFMEYNAKPVYPYFTGEYQETEPMSEDGMQEATFILNGFSRTTWAVLEEAKTSIENYFNRVYGKTVTTDSGNAVAIFYSSSLVVPAGDAELKRIQINLNIKEWKVNQ